MTREEFDALTPGTKIMVPMVMSSRYNAQRILAKFAGDVSISFAYSDLAEATIVPRPLAVGDRVKLKSSLLSNENTGRIEWLNDSHGLVIWPLSSSLSVHRLSDLTLVIP